MQSFFEPILPTVKVKLKGVEWKVLPTKLTKLAKGDPQDKGSRGRPIIITDWGNRLYF